MSSHCLIVMYHYVRDSAATPFPTIRALSPDDFERQLDWLQSNYVVLAPETFEAAVHDRITLPENAALLTFDDGFIDHHLTVFPTLRRRGLSGVFFLAGAASGAEPRMLGVHKVHFLLARLGAQALYREIVAARHPGGAGSVDVAGGPQVDADVFGADEWDVSAERALKQLLNYELTFAEAESILDPLFARWIGDDGQFARSLYLDAARIAEMAAGGMRFGYHTHSHRMLSRLDADEQWTELAEGVTWVRERTGQATVPFCYPWGGPKTYTSSTVAMLGRAGYSVAFNTVRRRAIPGRDSRYELPRIDTRDLPPYTAGEIPSASQLA